MRTTTPFLCAIAIVGLGSRVQASLITITSSNTTSTAWHGSYNANFDNSTIIPTNTTVSAALGGASSSTGIGYNELAGQTILKWDMDHVRAGGEYSFGRTEQSPIYFTALANTAFALTGTYSMTGNGTLNLFATLYDLTASQELFDNTQHSLYTEDESFILGQTSGDNYNWVEGSPTGSLIAGHQYYLSFDAYVFSYDGDIDGYDPNTASGEGNITLTIGDTVTATPEPATMALLGLTGLCGIGLRLRRRQNQQTAA